MALQMEMETLDGLNDEISKLYVERDGKYFLDVDGTLKPDKDQIPRSRLNQEIEKRKSAETTLDEIADTLAEEVPEEMRDIIPNLPPAQKIKWIKAATKKGLFDPKAKEEIDSKRPGDKKPQDLEGLSPQQKMALGYKT